MCENENKIEKAREFCQKVKELALEYDLPFFVVTDGASAISNNGCLAVKNARENHIKWEQENGFDPYEDWSKNDYITINNKKIDNYKVKVSWNNFTVNNYKDGKTIKRNGMAPFINFNIEDNILIGIETKYSKEMLENLKIDNKEDITKYVSDITYEDEKGWISIINSNYTCYLIRKDESKFHVILYVESEGIEKLDITIDAIIKLNNTL